MDERRSVYNIVTERDLAQIVGRILLEGILKKYILISDLIRRKVTPFETMTARTAPSSYGLLAEVFWGFPQLRQMPGDLCTAFGQKPEQELVAPPH